MNKSTAFLLATSALMLTSAPVIASAQTAQSDTSAQQPAPDRLETIVVTARKRSEDLLKVPVAVSALVAADLSVRGIQTIADVATFTPGLTADNASSGGARTDRSFQQLIIRGITPSSTLNPTTSVFINGSPVASADLLQAFDDIERVEVLKGPQSAYFGRETFAGAINVVTRAPTNSWTANISGVAGTLDTYNATGSISGPVVADKLSILLGGSYDTHGSAYKNAFNPSETLGKQTTKSFHGSFLLRPVENLTIKGFGMLFQDDDGPAATGILISSVAGKPQFSQGNCTITGTPFFCGTLPGIISSVSPAQNTTLTPTIAAFIANGGSGPTPGTIIKRSDIVQGFGLKRDAYHADMNVEYVVPNLGLTATVLGGFNQNNWSELSDLSNEDGAANGQYPGYTGFAFMVQHVHHDASIEFRLATDQTKPYRALVGVSYVDSYENQALGFTAVNLAPGGTTQSDTTGYFFSLAGDVLPKVTINFEGRYQQDKEISRTAVGVLSGQGISYNFLPRVSAQYKFTPNTMAYFTYSQGVNPGVFNSQFATLPAISQQELISRGVSGSTVVKPELITNYELGVKGRFLDGRATLSADVYYDQWTQQLNANTYNFAIADPGNPYNVVGSSTYNSKNVSIYGYLYTDNSASSIAQGVEAEAELIPIDHVKLNVSAAYNDTKYTAFNCTACLPYTNATTVPANSFNASGKYLPLTSPFSLTAGGQYSNTMNMFGGSEDWFVRADFVYKDGVYLQSDNFTKTPNVELVNLRAGVTWHAMSIEGYVNNVLNNRAYPTAFQNVNFAGGFTATTVDVALPQLVNGGVKVKYRF